MFSGFFCNGPSVFGSLPWQKAPVCGGHLDFVAGRWVVWCWCWKSRLPHGLPRACENAAAPFLNLKFSITLGLFYIDPKLSFKSASSPSGKHGNPLLLPPNKVMYFFLDARIFPACFFLLWFSRFEPREVVARTSFCQNERYLFIYSFIYFFTYSFIYLSISLFIHNSTFLHMHWDHLVLLT